MQSEKKSIHDFIDKQKVNNMKSFDGIGNELKDTVNEFNFKIENTDQHNRFKKLIWQILGEGECNIKDEQIKLEGNLVLEHSCYKPLLDSHKPDFAVRSDNLTLSSIK